MNGLKFIRVHGRVVPVRAKGSASNKYSSNYGKFAIAGALQRATIKTAPVFAASVGAVAGVANLVDSINHGQKNKSGLAGVGRLVENNIAFAAGSFGARIGISTSLKALRSKGLRNAAKKFGSMLANKSSGFSSAAGKAKNVSSIIKKLPGKY